MFIVMNFAHPVGIFGVDHIWVCASSPILTATGWGCISFYDHKLGAVGGFLVGLRDYNTSFISNSTELD